MRERAPNHAATVPEIIAFEQSREFGRGLQCVAVRGIYELHFGVQNAAFVQFIDCANLAVVPAFQINDFKCQWNQGWVDCSFCSLIKLRLIVQLIRVRKCIVQMAVLRQAPNVAVCHLVEKC